VNGFDELVVTTQRKRLGIGNSNLEFAGQAIEAHCTPPSNRQTPLARQTT
jgi:hypothetical protein